MRNSVFVALLSLVALAACDQVAQQGPSAGGFAFHGPSKIVQHSNTTLDARTQGRFERFKAEKGSFAAMYVAGNGVGWGAIKNSVSLEDAKSVALATCQGFSNSGCTLYATVEPTQPIADGALPNVFRDSVTDRFQATQPGRFMATAVSPSGRSASSANQPDEAKASSEALAQCRTAVAEQAKELTSGVLSRLSSRGLTDCRVVLLRQKS